MTRKPSSHIRFIPRILGDVTQTRGRGIRVLSMDGGGVRYVVLRPRLMVQFEETCNATICRGLLTLEYLRELEYKTGKRVSAPTIKQPTVHPCGPPVNMVL